jgi:hypothetical protein
VWYITMNVWPQPSDIKVLLEIWKEYQDVLKKLQHLATRSLMVLLTYVRIVRIVLCFHCSAHIKRGSSRRGEKSHGTHVTWGYLEESPVRHRRVSVPKRNVKVRVQMFPEDQTLVLSCRSFSLALFSLNELVQAKEIWSNHAFCIQHHYLSW